MGFDDEEKPILRAEETVALLRAAAAGSRGWLWLADGIPDARMDAWHVPVPEGIRTLLRAVGGLILGGSWVGDLLVSYEERFHFDHPENHHPMGGSTWQAGQADERWVVCLDAAGAAYYVDVDRHTGRWGRVFAFWEAAGCAYVAPDLVSWTRSLAEAFHERASEEPEDVFARWLHGDAESRPRLVPLSAPQARRSDDPALTAIAAGLPDSAFIADLRHAPYRADIVFDGPEWPIAIALYRRFRGGDFLVACPEDD